MIIKYEESAEILRTVSEPVTKFNRDLISLVNTMFTAIEREKGVGLAAIQLGIAKRVLVIHNPHNGTKVAVVNPSWEKLDETTTTAKEGCLSAPGKYIEKERYAHIKINFQNLQGKPQERILKDFDARIFQHEYDHLEGKCIVGDS